MQDVLAKIQRHQRLPGVKPVTIHSEGDGGGAAKRAPETDNAKEHGRHDPRVAFFSAPAKAHETRGGGEGDRRSHDEAELGLVDAAVAAGHALDDKVGGLAGDGGAEDAADERGDVDEAGGEGGEVVGVRGAVDGGDGFGEDDEPADGEGVDGRGP